ncbi:MAG: carbon storage regulator [Planctomycetia bacterium]|nr:carbon storage regulator [Planctomycetia bacterium]
MLVLSRRLGERVVIGPDIVVTILAARGGTVKLGFSAPHEVAIHREELRARMDTKSKERSNQGTPSDSPLYAEFA